MSDNRNKISGCIVTYNNAAIISECIESILEWTKDISFKLYISDNGSTDGTVQLIQKNIRKLQSLKTNRISVLVKVITG